MNELGGGCFPSIPTQAKDTSLTDRAVYKAISDAEAKGFLLRKKILRIFIAGFFIF